MLDVTCNQLVILDLLLLNLPTRLCSYLRLLRFPTDGNILTMEVYLSFKEMMNY